jgi:hypothetical protein
MSLTIVSLRYGKRISERHLILGARDMVITLSAWSLRRAAGGQKAQHAVIVGVFRLTFGTVPQLRWACHVGSLQTSENDRRREGAINATEVQQTWRFGNLLT